jgi:hypothetical protein
LQKLIGRENLNALERIQCEKVRVAADYVSSLAAHREFEELVVLRITAGRDPHIHFDPFGLSSQNGEKPPNIFLVYIFNEFFSAKDCGKLGEDGKRKQNTPFSESQFECMTRS